MAGGTAQAESASACAIKERVMAMTGKAMRELWATARQYGVTSDMLHQMAESELLEAHISKLNVRQLKYLTARCKGEHPTVPSVGSLISPAQVGFIRNLERKLGWSDNEKRLIGFIKKYTKKDNLSELTSIEASRVIEGLKKLAERMDTGWMKL